MEVMSECEEYSSVVESVDTLSNNRDVLYQCRTLADEKEDFRYFVRWANNKIDKLNAEIQEKDAEKVAIVAEKEAEKEAIVAEKDAEIAALKEQLKLAQA